MKPFISCSIILMVCAGCVTRAPEKAQSVTVYVPAQLNVERTQDTFSVGFDNFRSFVPTNITVNPQQSESVVYDVYVYRIGEPRPAEPDWHGRHRDLDFGFAPCVCHEYDEEFPLAGPGYVVDMDAAVFETDPANVDDENFGLLVPTIANNPRFKILWKGHLEQIVR